MGTEGLLRNTKKMTRTIGGMDLIQSVDTKTNRPASNVWVESPASSPRLVFGTPKHVGQSPWESTQLSFLPFFFFFQCLFIYFERARERERESEHKLGRGRERETQKLKEAPGSKLSAQSLIWGLNPRTVRS